MLVLNSETEGNFVFKTIGQHHFSPESVIKKPNPIEHVSTEGDISSMIGPGSEDLVWLVITKWIGPPSVDRCAIWFGFLITYFEDIWREVVVSLKVLP